jgi:putative ABC transport system permease protein
MAIMWLLAIKSMLADRGKLLTSLLGVTFAVVLVNMQGGLLLGLIQKSAVLIDYGQADIWVGHRHMTNVDMGAFIPERWVHRIRGIEGVERADPYVVAGSQMQMANGQFENVLVLGSNSASLLGNAWAMAQGNPGAIRYPDGILVDVYDTAKLGDCRIGDLREINGHRAKVVGMTQGILGFTNVPYVFTTLERARKNYSTTVPPGQCSYFLVRVKAGADMPRVCARIRERLPEAGVYDKKTYAWTSMDYWLTRTGIGMSFGLATVLGLLVGLAVVAQTLYASVTERIKEFGTLKAMGADDRSVARFLFSQAMGTAALGSALGLFCSYLIGQSLSTPRVSVVLTWYIAVISVVLIFLVCLAAAWLPYWRIRRIDPASVLRS